MTTAFYHWRAWRNAPGDARSILGALYDSPEVKRICTGLFGGGVAALAEVAALPFGDAVTALALLVERGLVEHDPAERVIRLTQFPDRSERPANPNCLIRWWKGFQSVTACRVRDNHVALIEWVCTPLSSKHLDVWVTTFGTVESDRVHSDTHLSTVPRTVPLTVTGTVRSNVVQQTDLFEKGKLGGGLGDGSSNHTDTDHGNGYGNGPGSRRRITDLGEEHEERVVHSHPSAGGSPGLTGLAMIAAIAKSSGGRISADLVDDRLLGKLDAVAARCFAAGASLADCDLAGRFLAAGGLAHRDDLGASWMVRPGTVMDLIGNARGWRDGTVKIAAQGKSEDEEEGPYKPRPPSAFRTGIRVL